ncbi:helix-turn-helix domain-containing protein [Alicyclobacillus kakegawensis]|uniref:helix-turn-helix domain-containing protein n=1 Tax=Alicyclobacillus kakegawensis TaxID=392012 RepID=UPI00082B2690|nr:helix-turn-helix transcriptional regulator [Alicyclobacillus kakegawensis]
MSDLQNYIQKRMQNPGFAKEWEASKLEYEVARQLIQLRKQSGLSQAQLAKRVHTRQSEISRIENGEQNISLDKLRKIANALGADVEIKIGKKENKESVKA